MSTPRSTSSPSKPSSGEEPDGKKRVMSGGERKRALMTVAFTLFLDMVGFGIILPLLPLYGRDLGASATAVAMLATAFSVSQFIFGPVLGRWSDRHGRRPVMLVSIAGSIVSGLVLGFANAFWVVVAARLLAGASKANISTAHAYVADVTSPDERAKYMGMMGGALGMGFVFGPAIGGLLHTEVMPSLPFFVSAGLAAVNLAMAVVWLPETRFIATPVGEAARPSLTFGVVKKQLVGTVLGFIILVNFIGYFAFSSMESTYALFNHDVFDWGVTETGYLFSGIGFVMAMVQVLLIGPLVKWLGEAGTLTLGSTILGIGLLLMGGIEQWASLMGLPGVRHLDGTLSHIAIVCVVLGSLCFASGNALISPSVSSLVSRLSNANEQGWNLGLRESASSLARITGPMMAGPLFEYVSPGTPMMAGAALSVVSVILAAMLVPKMKRWQADKDRSELSHENGSGESSVSQ